VRRGSGDAFGPRSHASHGVNLRCRRRPGFDRYRKEQSMPSLANIEGTEVVIRIPLTALPHAAEVAWNDAYERHGLFVEDVEAFAKEFVRYLNDEDEEGTTVLHLAFDKAVINATEQGAFGIGDSADAETPPGRTP
jgi:hypothetical protein